jgi:quinol-cytochrome oxidoreductase complex cytochrome b subunit
MSRLNDETDKTKNEKYAKIFSSTYGQIAFASFLIAAISGVLIAIPFDIKNPFDSISIILLTNPAANLFRVIHYWSAQFFLVFTILHFWDHLTLSTEKNVRKGVWLRLTIALLVIFYAMLSGFILKGDADSIQAKNILTTLLQKIPLIGNELSYSLLGSEKDFQIPYIQHIAAATIFLWIIAVEHSKVFWPKLRIVLLLIPIFIAIGFFFPPSLNADGSGIIKGPWYFLGLQELLHYLSHPALSIIVVLFFLLLIYLIPFLNQEYSRLIKKVIFISGSIYFLLIAIGLFFRGENWRLELPWKHKLTNEININTNFNFSPVSVENFKDKKIPVILGRREGCLFCHYNTKGFSPAHSPDAIGCASCHMGNVFTLNKNDAHKGMILIPGNLDDAKETCGNTKCHPDIPDRVNNAIMTTLTGIVSVDRYAFGESDSLNKFNRIANIDHSPADQHLRNLCSSCHLGNKKLEIGPITQTSRGGGCNACHLIYSKEALNNINKLSNSTLRNSETPGQFIHPSLSINISDEHCFGCHSRSGRISTNYEGWAETELDSLPSNKNSEFRELEDGRIFKKEPADVHYDNGMSCIDCHTSKEIMGDGNIYLHKEDQVKIQCTDCHTNGKPVTTEFENADQESQKIITLRKYDIKKRKYLITQNNSYILTNTYVDSANHIRLLTLNDNKDLIIKPPASICTEGQGHKRLSCNSCHTSWVSQCINCHTDYNSNAEVYDNLTRENIKGGWIETSSDFQVDEPTLGVKIIKDKNGNEKEVIDNFIPGMIIHISDGEKSIFKRLFAPASPHTISKGSRSCESCHNNPLALGYGRGKLIFTKDGRWKFIPSYKLSINDSLPEDAWIGFLSERKSDFATRNNVRPFTVEEQKRILTAGACLNCHNSNSASIKQYLDTGKIPNLSKQCLIPKWN